MRGAATRVHIAADCSVECSFSCLRKGSVLQESGEIPSDALDITSGLCRKFFDKCWSRLPPAAVAELERLMEGRAGGSSDR